MENPKLFLDTISLLHKEALGRESYMGVSLKRKSPKVVLMFAIVPSITTATDLMRKLESAGTEGVRVEHLENDGQRFRVWWLS